MLEEFAAIGKGTSRGDMKLAVLVANVAVGVCIFVGSKAKRKGKEAKGEKRSASPDRRR
jgi:hypothetical protein